MARYRKIETRIWNDQKFNELSDDGKLLLLMLLTHPHLTSIGAMRATLPGLASELHWSLERLQQAGPTPLPILREFCPASEGVYKFVVSIPPRLLAVRRQEVGPAREQVPGDVLHDDGDAVRVGVEGGVQLVVGELGHGLVRPALV